MGLRNWLAVLVLGLAATLSAQRRAAPVTGAPFSAEEVTERVQTLPDGTHLTHTSTVMIYRDSQGRTRREPQHAGALPAIIGILDPVAHVRYLVNPRLKTVSKYTLSPRQGLPMQRSAGGPMARPTESPDAKTPRRSTEDLGTETMEGLLVTGTRRTVRWPAGSRLGNDRPVTTTEETWVSPDLQEVVLSKRTDPERGNSTRKLINISRAEPDPSLFQPPPDYRIVEDNGEVFPH